MCTVTWRLGNDGYDLFFNRDELDARAPEHPPRVAKAHGVSFLAPRDGDHGGTWLLVNHYGVTVCLLNDYADPWRPADGLTYSRGQVVLTCASARDAHEAFALAQRAPLVRCRSFQLLVLAPDQRPSRLRWHGGQIEIDDGANLQPPLSSSSWNTAAVIAARERLYGHTVAMPGSETSTDRLWRYHTHHDPAHGAHSVLMRRPDAATRSIIHVAAGSTAIYLHYRPVDRQSLSTLLKESRFHLTRPALPAVATGKDEATME